MQIDKIQAAQPKFGTKVKIDCPLLVNDIHYRSVKYKEELAKVFKSLEQNGRGDVFIISDNGRGNALASLCEVKRSSKPSGFASIRKFSYIFNIQDSSSPSCINDIYDYCHDIIQDSVSIRIKESALKEWEKYLI